MENLNQSKNLNLKNAVDIKVYERDGAPVLVVKDNHLSVEFHSDLPSNFMELPDSKKNYWINKELQVIARKIKSSVKTRQNR